MCGNFEFFRLHSKGCEASTVPTLQERTFNTKVEMVYKLQELSLQTAELQEYRKELVASLVAQIKALPRDNFAVKQHLRVIDKYQSEADFTVLEFKQTQEIAEHVAPLVLPLGDDPTASRFDQLVYQIELAMLTGKNFKRAQNDIRGKAEELAKLGTIPDVAAQKRLDRRNSGKQLFGSYWSDRIRRVAH